MKLFQKLLVAPAAIGLFSPVVANAAELNINDVSEYSTRSSRSARIARKGNTKRVTGVSQFSDVYPTDWAYQALAGMLERHNCAPITANGSMTRYEAAALLNKCLGNVAQANSEERRLINEFSAELAVIKGRLDGVEAGIGAEGPGFSTTTSMEGQTTFTIAANSFDGKKLSNSDNVGGTVGNEVNESTANWGGTTFSFDVQLALTTSFTGEDALVTIIRSGNFHDLQTGDASVHGVSTFEVGYDSAGADTFDTDKIYYTTPFGDFNVVLGARVGQEDMLAIWPTVYQSDATTTLLNVTTVAGAPGAYHKNLGSGVGVSWQNDSGFAVSANYVAGEDTAYSADASAGGFMTDGSKGTTTVQVGYTKDQWGVAAAYSYLQDSTLVGTQTKFLSGKLGGTGDEGTDAYALSAYWMPEETGGFIPSISAGYGWNVHDTETNDYAEESSSWMVGLEWNEVLGEGNAAGIAIGSAVGATSMKGGASVDDDNLVMEAWYKYRVSDNVVVSPGVFLLDSPLGDNDSGKSRDYEQVGAVLRTTFTF